MGSESARFLAESLGALRVRPNGNYRPRATDFIINWGNGNTPQWAYQHMLNRPIAVHNAANKLNTFRILHEAGVSVPDFSINRDDSHRWNREGHSVYARNVLTGHSGEGIEVIGQYDYEIENPAAPLYVKAIENHGEYRVHVFGGRVIDYTKKRRHNGDEPTDAQNAVRNLANGWVYTRGNLRRLERVENIAVRAVSALGLDFGAVDIIMNEDGDVFVLEVNTACGLADTTLDNYVNAFHNAMNHE